MIFDAPARLGDLARPRGALQSLWSLPGRPVLPQTTLSKNHENHEILEKSWNSWKIMNSNVTVVPVQAYKTFYLVSPVTTSQQPSNSWFRALFVFSGFHFQDFWKISFFRKFMIFMVSHAFHVSMTWHDGVSHASAPLTIASGRWNRRRRLPGAVPARVHLSHLLHRIQRIIFWKLEIFRKPWFFKIFMIFRECRLGQYRSPGKAPVIFHQVGPVWEAKR